MNAQEQITKCKEFLETSYQNELHEIANKDKKSLIIDFKDLVAFDPALGDFLIEQPEESIATFEQAIENFDLGSFKARFTNLPKSQFILIQDIRSSHLGKFIYLEGIVRQSSDIRPQVTLARFECPSCGNVLSIPQLDQKFKEPSRCSCGRRGKFRLLSKILVDAQRIVLEEIPELLEGGEQPKRISVFVKEDLVEPVMEKRTTPGSKVRVYGIIKEVPIILHSGGQSTRYDLMVETNFISPLEESFGDLKVSKKEEKEIIEISKSPSLFQDFVQSTATSIFGHEKIKEALILQLMGGVKKTKPDGTASRGDMHVLLVGDPGTAKSSLISSLSKLAPKSRLTGGKSASGAGLTATVVKDEFLKGWALEAGAIVLANGGHLFIDELDKMTVEDRNALHEALEQQRISISKANIQATLKAETSVLAAANPKLSRFDPYTPIAAQIDLPASLINRFDLIFPIRDIQNREIDEKIASHVLNIHQEVQKIEPKIPPQIYKKYVSYAKKIKPVLGEKAIEEIKRFYVELRNKDTGDGEELKPIPISARQLEALIRLSEGSARLRLSKKVTKKDAKIAIDLLRYCLMQVGFDYETGQIDIDKIYTGMTTSTRSKIVTVREIINDLENKVGKNIPLEEVIALSEVKNISETQVEESIEKLKKEGFLFEPRRGVISKL